MDSQRSKRVDVTLVTGGKYHDFDFARLELLGLLAEHEEFRVRVQPDYEDTDAIASGSILVSYTCDVRPSAAAQLAIRSWVHSGARWLALHGTNAALDLDGSSGVDAPIAVGMMSGATMGSGGAVPNGVSFGNSSRRPTPAETP